jgi:hypothetical protein
MTQMRGIQVDFVHIMVVGGKAMSAPEADVKEMVQAMADWLVAKICPQTQRQHLRTKPTPDAGIAPSASANKSITRANV